MGGRRREGRGEDRFMNAEGGEGENGIWVKGGRQKREDTGRECVQSKSTKSTVKTIQGVPSTVNPIHMKPNPEKMKVKSRVVYILVFSQVSRDKLFPKKQCHCSVLSI